MGKYKEAFTDLALAVLFLWLMGWGQLFLIL